MLSQYPCLNGMLNSDSSDSSRSSNVRYLPTNHCDSSVSTGQIDLDFPIDVHSSPDLRATITKSSSFPDPSTTCLDQSLQHSRSLSLADKAIVHQPLSNRRFSFRSSEDVSETNENHTYPHRPSLSDIPPMFRHHVYREDNQSDTLSDTSSISSPHSPRKGASGESYRIEDDLIVIDGQIVTKDSNVDPILCRLKRQQVVAGTRPKESSIASDMLAAEKVRFDRNINIKRFDEDEWGEVSPSIIVSIQTDVCDILERMSGMR